MDYIKATPEMAAVFLYERRGCRTTGHGVLAPDNDIRLVYEIMEKTLRPG